MHPCPRKFPPTSGRSLQRLLKSSLPLSSSHDLRQTAYQNSDLCTYNQVLLAVLVDGRTEANPTLRTSPWSATTSGTVQELNKMSKPKTFSAKNSKRLTSSPHLQKGEVPTQKMKFHAFLPYLAINLANRIAIRILETRFSSEGSSSSMFARSTTLPSTSWNVTPVRSVIPCP